ncbi:MAG: sensor histidine kinase [Chitinophagales bacterium]
MKNNQIRLVVLLGVVAIIAIVSVQVYWLRTAFDIKERQFNETIHSALINVAKNISTNGESLSNEDIVSQLSSDYFVVNINDVIDANVLEYYLTNEFENLQLELDFEYAIYDCGSDKMVYGDYISLEDGRPESPTTNLATYNEYIYYFGVYFPTKANFVVSNLRLSLIFSVILLLAVVFFGYAMYVILKQKKLSELQTDFINNMTHEFKTPIASIGLSSDVLMKNEVLKNDGRLSKYVKIIKEQTDRLTMQVEKVLQIAKIQGDDLKLHLEEIDLIKTINSVQRSAAINYEKKGGEIIFQTKESIAIIKADKLHLTNILFNILDNSLKYNEKTPLLNINLTKSGKHFELIIKDNGIGINEKYLKQVFERFFRVPTGNIHNVKGFGLGLFYVKQVVEQHRWKIIIDSKENEGTTIKIKL